MRNKYVRALTCLTLVMASIFLWQTQADAKTSASLPPMAYFHLYYTYNCDPVCRYIDFDGRTYFKDRGAGKSKGYVVEGHAKAICYQADYEIWLSGKLDNGKYWWPEPWRKKADYACRKVRDGKDFAYEGTWDEHDAQVLVKICLNPTIGKRECVQADLVPASPLPEQETIPSETKLPTGKFLIEGLSLDSSIGRPTGACARAKEQTETIPLLEIQGHPLTTGGCNKNDPNQVWSYDPQSRKLSVNINGQQQCAVGIDREIEALLYVSTCSLPSDSGTKRAIATWRGNNLSNFWTHEGYPEQYTIGNDSITPFLWAINPSEGFYDRTCPHLGGLVAAYSEINVEKICPGVVKPFVHIRPVA
ncbi:hypothetical protein F0L68_15645 [Solihabitans fulvus]|uniref:Uncharacterized protein n=1 Tax=Solihabitans fulvus TaxID=1892852 RepID=A0A5B2XFW6_9PSEU|nr:hypothetical protein [Solihabitans fulvus]KAA2261682.1 hypothetical protein F0L68_15645 [Solihabitans fulvus]